MRARARGQETAGLTDKLRGAEREVLELRAAAESSAAAADERVRHAEAQATAAEERLRAAEEARAAEVAGLEAKARDAEARADAALADARAAQADADSDAARKLAQAQVRRRAACSPRTLPTRRRGPCHAARG